MLPTQPLSLGANESVRSTSKEGTAGEFWHHAMLQALGLGLRASLGLSVHTVDSGGLPAKCTPRQGHKS